MRLLFTILVSAIVFCGCNDSNKIKKQTAYVNAYIGTGGEGRIHPAVRMPYGMVQLGPDTRKNNSGYHYSDSTILGYSHVHKSGGGCGDFLDILFMPFERSNKTTPDFKNLETNTIFSHEQEFIHPGYYAVRHQKNDIFTELTATRRCGMHRYSFRGNGQPSLLIDLEHGNDGACTIVSEDNYDTVVLASINMPDRNTIEGYKISSGWAEEQHVYFSTMFSQPIKNIYIYADGKLLKDVASAAGQDIKAVLDFGSQEELIVKTGISSVSISNAKQNLAMEIPHWNFDTVSLLCNKEWEEELSAFKINGGTSEQKEMFFTALYNTLTYPMLYSDQNGDFRGPDHQIHKTSGGNNYSGVLGLWDTFRAANPLLMVLRPDITNDLIISLLDHYKIYGQLPIWTLAGNETFQMIGLHSMPIIADEYYKGIRDFDANYALKAMITSAMKDTIGYSMRQFVGLKNYLKYGYVPADLETEATARTLEYAYDDWCISEMATQLGAKTDQEYFLNRASNYQNVIDTASGFARGKLSDGSWRTPFDPFYSSHRTDDFCEGNAWQWTFFVPHDVKGLGQLLGGVDALEQKLDLLFSQGSEISGKNASGDITGLIGQYAHGNEPSHHIPFMYSYTKSPWKTEEIVRQIMNEQYNTSPEGISGNDDTGQMSAWYVWNAMGLYPFMHGNGVYVIGSPLFEKIELNHPGGLLEIKALNISEDQRYIQEVLLNGTPYEKAYIEHKDLFSVNTKLTFVMGKNVNKHRGNQMDFVPPSMSD